MSIAEQSATGVTIAPGGPNLSLEAQRLLSLLFETKNMLTKPRGQYWKRIPSPGWKHVIRPEWDIKTTQAVQDLIEIGIIERWAGDDEIYKLSELGRHAGNLRDIGVILT